MKRRSLILGGAAALAAGCGGGRGAFKPGRAVFTIAWPETPTRLIPQASQSVAIEIRLGTEVLARKVIARPATTATFDSLTDGELTAVATAHPNSDGTGVAQAIGVAPLTIRDGETTQIALTMASTIVGFSLAFSTLGVGETRRIIGTFRDAQNAVVMVSPEQCEYSVTGNSGAISFDIVNRLCTGVAPGQVQLQIKNLETGALYNTSFEVVATATLPDIVNPIPGWIADPSRYLIWYLGIGTQLLIGYDPDTGIPVRHITVPADARLGCLSYAGKYLFFNTSDSSKCIILDIDAKQMLPGEIKIPGHYISVYAGLNTTLTNDQSCVVYANGPNIGDETVNIFDGFVKRPGNINVEYTVPDVLSDTGNSFYMVLSGSFNYYIERCSITASGISRPFVSNYIDASVVAVTDSIVITRTRKIYSANNFSLIRELDPIPQGTYLTKGIIEGDILHSLIQIPESGLPFVSYASYYARHSISSGALLSFVQLPQGGVQGTTTALVLYGYKRLSLLRHYILFESVNGWCILKKK